MDWSSSSETRTRSLETGHEGHPCNPYRADSPTANELGEEDLGLAVAAAAADMADNTRRGYGFDLDDFQAHCAEHQVPGLPAAPAVIAAYLAIRGHREPRLSVASLARQLAAICKLHDLNGYRGQGNPGRHPPAHLDPAAGPRGW